MFQGAQQVKVEDRGRVTLSPKFRLSLGEEFIVTKGLGGCLLVMHQDEWDEKFKNYFKPASIFDLDAMKLQRHFIASATTTSSDGQGRTPISQHLREYAGLEVGAEVVILGMTTRLEIWSKDRFDDYTLSVTDEELAAAAARMGLWQPNAEPATAAAA